MNSSRLPKLTTTSFALLGLLRRRPWSAYELTRYMRNSILRAVWPRAESHLYSEPKALEKRGFATSHQEQNGARKRTVYSITEDGRAALSRWLHEERESEFRFEYELLVRFAFAEYTDSGQLQKYLQQARNDALRDARFALLGVERLREEEEARSQNYMAHNGAMIHLLVDQLQTRIRWSEQMLEKFSKESAAAPQPAMVEELLDTAAERLRLLVGKESS
jgi:PadR family transcriptional regulator AphA